MKLSIVIPAYNEEKRINYTISHIIQTFQNNGWSENNYEILIVNDGSTDKTIQIVNELAQKHKSIKLLNCYKNSGKGMALRLGVIKAKGDIIIIYDADAATPAKFIIEYYHLIEANNYDIIIGSRELGIKEKYIVQYEKLRRISGRIFTALSKIVITGFKDTQCGFKLFKKNVAKHLFSILAQSGYAWDIELLALANYHSYKLKEVPIDWYHQPGSKVSLIKDSIIMVWQLLKIKKRMLNINKEKWEKNNPCFICGCSYWKLIKKINEWQIIQCGICKLGTIFPKLTTEDLAKLYNKDYFLLGDKTAGYHDYITWEKFIEKTAKKRLSMIDKYITKQGKLLEIGCATGYFLNIATKRRWDVKGIEISQWAATTAKELLGKDKIIHSPVENAIKSFQSNEYDLIVAWDVFEHIPNLDLLLPQLHNLLSANGLLAFTTPNSDGLLAKISGKHWHNYQKIPEHVYFFNRNNLSQLLYHNNFEIIVAKPHGKHIPFGFFIGRFLEILSFKSTNIKENNLLNKYGFYCNPTDIIFILAKKG